MQDRVLVYPQGVIVIAGGASPSLYEHYRYCLPGLATSSGESGLSNRVNREAIRAGPEAG